MFPREAAAQPITHTIWQGESYGLPTPDSSGGSHRRGSCAYRTFPSSLNHPGGQSLPLAASSCSNSPVLTEVSTAGCGAGWPCRAQEAPVLSGEVLEWCLNQDSRAGGLSGLVIGTATAKQILQHFSSPRRICGSIWSVSKVQCSHKNPSTNSLLHHCSLTATTLPAENWGRCLCWPHGQWGQVWGRFWKAVGRGICWMSRLLSMRMAEGQGE